MGKFCLVGHLKVGSVGWLEIFIFSTLPTPPNQSYPSNQINNPPIQFIMMLPQSIIKGMEHVPNIFMSFDKYLFLEMINILI